MIHTNEEITKAVIPLHLNATLFNFLKFHMHFSYVIQFRCHKSMLISNFYSLSLFLPGETAWENQIKIFPLPGIRA